MKESGKHSEESSLELRDSAAPDFELPDGTGFTSVRSPISLDEVISFSEERLARFWSDSEFVRARRAQQIEVPFEL
jgi:hypothetical protein